MTEGTDTALEQRAREGNRAAAARLLEEARDDLVRFCYRYLGNVEEAEDAAQSVLTAMIERPWPAGSYRAYLFRAARNQSLGISSRRQDGRVGIGSFLGDTRLPSPRTGPQTAAVRADEEELLRRHLATLAPGQAEVLTLRYFEGMSRKEIAEIVELDESIVKSRLHEGLKALDKLVRRSS